MTSPLQGGSMRRRRVRPSGWLLLIAISLAVGAAAIALIPEGSGGGGSVAEHVAAAQPAVATPNPNRRLIGKLPIQSPPGVSMVGPNAVRVHLNSKPAAGLLFDVDTGRVLWRAQPPRRPALSGGAQTVDPPPPRGRAAGRRPPPVQKEGGPPTPPPAGRLPGRRGPGG